MLLFLAVYLGSAFSPALQDDVDTSHAEAAREMITRGDYVTLHINGVRYLEKAPMMYWLVAGCYRVFGVNEFATRLPTVAAMFLLVLLGIVMGTPRLRPACRTLHRTLHSHRGSDIFSSPACSSRRRFSAS